MAETCTDRFRCYFFNDCLFDFAQVESKLRVRLVFPSSNSNFSCLNPFNTCMPQQEVFSPQLIKDQTFSVDRHIFQTEILSYSSRFLSLVESKYLLVSAT